MYDNLGLETAWKRYTTILVSNAGGKLGDDATPPIDWARQSKRVLDVIDNQVRNLRARQVVGSLKNRERRGAYWSIRTAVADYPAPNCLTCTPGAHARPRGDRDAPRSARPRAPGAPHQLGVRDHGRRAPGLPRPGHPNGNGVPVPHERRLA